MDKIKSYFSKSPSIRKCYEVAYTRTAADKSIFYISIYSAETVRGAIHAQANNPACY